MTCQIDGSHSRYIEGHRTQISCWFKLCILFCCTIIQGKSSRANPPKPDVTDKVQVKLQETVVYTKPLTAAQTVTRVPPQWSSSVLDPQHVVVAGNLSSSTANCPIQSVNLFTFCQTPLIIAGPIPCLPDTEGLLFVGPVLCSRVRAYRLSCHWLYVVESW